MLEITQQLQMKNSRVNWLPPRLSFDFMKQTDAYSIRAAGVDPGDPGWLWSGCTLLGFSGWDSLAGIVWLGLCGWDL